MRTVGVARCAISSPWRVSRARRWVSARRTSAAARCGGRLPGAAHVDVEPGIGRRHLDVERLLHRAERFGERPGGGDRAVERWRQHRATVDRDDVVCPIGRKADLEHVMHAAPRMEDRAPPTLPVRVDQVADRRIEAGLAQCRADQARASIPDSARNPSAGSGSRRTRRNAGRSARCARALGVSTRNR